MHLREVCERHPHLAPVVDALERHDRADELFPPQEEAVRAGLLDGGSFLLVFGTGSGKTLMGELFALDAVLREGRMAVFIVPLKALASEKYAGFRAKYEPLGLRVGMATGDLDAREQWLGGMDLVVCTTEKLESLVRHGAPWLGRVGALVVDEVHELDDAERGPTLEVVVTRLRASNPGMRLLGLSATVGNPEEIARWLGARLVSSPWRPVPLEEGVLLDGVIRFKGGRRVEVGRDRHPELPLLRDTLSQGKQLLVFAATKRSAEAVARKCRPVAARALTGEEREALAKASARVLAALPRPTKQCRALAEMVADGAAFHHAGLVYAQRAAVEDAFREGLVKVIASTPTLAAGVNLPSFRVVVKGHKMFSAGEGSRPISVIRYRQQAGRAGRIAYDERGEAVLVADGAEELEELWDRYLEGEVEPVTSKLSVRPVLRMHVLGLVATSPPLSVRELERFLAGTFYATQYGDLEALMSVAEGVVSDLVDMGFVGWGQGRMRATPLGRRVAELYVDPATASALLEFLRRSEGRGLPPVAYLAKLCESSEMRPLVRGRGAEVEARLAEEEGHLDAPEPFTYEYERYLDVFQTALMLGDWVDEAGEDAIMERYGVAPGELNQKLERAEWLMYAASELARVVGLREGHAACSRLHARIEQGVREELLPLVSLRNVGRVRARRLFGAGIRSLADLRRASPTSVARLLGPAVARSVLEQVGRAAPPEGGEVAERPSGEEEGTPGSDVGHAAKARTGGAPARPAGRHRTLLDFM